MNYLTIDKENVCNGEGLRVVLWLSGCSHKCKGCQNPQTWDANSGIQFDEEVKEKLFRELEKDYISGLTLTGGDPLFESNLNDVLELVDETRILFQQKTIWIYTGYLFEDILCDPLKLEIIKKCDVLVDGEYVKTLRDISLPFKGSTNQRVIDVQKTLKSEKIILYGQE